MSFSDTPAGRRFVASAAERDTADAVLYAIALTARDDAEAEAIWRSRLLPGQNARVSAEAIYEVARRNMPVAPAAMRWHGDASWAIRVENRALANRAAGHWLGHRREIILRADGLTLLRVGTMLVAEHASPLPVRSGPLWTFVSDAQADLAQRGTLATGALLAELALVRAFADDASGVVLAAKAARDWLVDHGEDEGDYAVTAIAPTMAEAAVTVQRFDARGERSGQPAILSITIEPPLRFR